MQGGGYSYFLNHLKKSADNNCLAKFIIIDFDRVTRHPGERKYLNEIISYCKLQNNCKKTPHFLVLNNPNFEYIACLHTPGYQGQDVKNYLRQVLGFHNIEEFKAKKDIYNYLNTKDHSFRLMLSKLQYKLVVNHYELSKPAFELKILHTDILWEHETKKCSNINEFFEIIDW